MTEEIVERQGTRPHIGETIGKNYHTLLQAEARPPELSDAIPVGHLERGSIDYKRFVARGIAPDILETGYVPRGILLEAGFAFQNRFIFPGTMGREEQAEKPLIQATIFVNGKGVDLGKFSFLTKEELDEVIAYQRGHPERYGNRGIPLDDVRQDMVSLLFGNYSKGSLPPLGHSVNALHVATSQYNYSRWDNIVVKAYFKHNLYKDVSGTYAERWERREKLDRAFMQEHMSDIYPWVDMTEKDWRTPAKIRNVQRNGLHFTSRVSALFRQPSPFLDSGFIFSTNPDEHLAIEGLGARRINMVTVHLLSRGLSEMGRGSLDQQYVTLGEYIETLFAQEPRQRSEYYQEEERLYTEGEGVDIGTYVFGINRRVLALANQWAEEEGSLFVRSAMAIRDRRGYCEI